MKRIVRLTESDLTRIVRRVISESEDALVNQIDSELDSIDDNSPQPNPIQKIIDRIEDAGHDVEDFINRLKRNGRKLKRKINRFMRDLRFKRRRPMLPRNFRHEEPNWGHK
jgi:hypothetical protein